MAQGIAEHLEPAVTLGTGGDTFTPNADAAREAALPGARGARERLRRLTRRRRAGDHRARRRGCTVLTALLALRLGAGRVAAAVAALLCAVSPTLVYWSGYTGPDPVAQALALGAALTLLHRRPVVGGALAGLCMSDTDRLRDRRAGCFRRSSSPCGRCAAKRFDRPPRACSWPLPSSDWFDRRSSCRRLPRSSDHSASQRWRRSRCSWPAASVACGPRASPPRLSRRLRCSTAAPGRPSRGRTGRCFCSPSAGSPSASGHRAAVDRAPHRGSFATARRSLLGKEPWPGTLCRPAPAGARPGSGPRSGDARPYATCHGDCCVGLRNGGHRIVEPAGHRSRFVPGARPRARACARRPTRDRHSRRVWVPPAGAARSAGCGPVPRASCSSTGPHARMHPECTSRASCSGGFRSSLVSAGPTAPSIAGRRCCTAAASPVSVRARAPGRRRGGGQECAASPAPAPALLRATS